MPEILVEHQPSPMKLEVLGVDDWPVCNESVGMHYKEYGQTETTLILEGSATLIQESGEKVSISSGDLVTFLPDVRCRWHIKSGMSRHCQKG